ncbi:hypothetical protein [Streptomyces glaucescens]|uniref:hypothetical protein n=1 Tax=Streptomyces glaucescens TaxID=1907 RepID=UPI0030DBB680
MVVGHPRSDSLTAQLAQRARDRLAAHGFSVDVLDLHAEGFDPRTGPADEPDWEDREVVHPGGTSPGVPAVVVGCRLSSRATRLLHVLPRDVPVDELPGAVKAAMSVRRRGGRRSRVRWRRVRTCRGCGPWPVRPAAGPRGGRRG